MKEIVTLCNKWIFFAFVVAFASPAYAESWTLRVWDELLDFASPSHTISYEPLTDSAKPWQLCALYPHLKDSYWLSVNYGMVEHAEKLGVSLRVLEAGGYFQIENQRQQLEKCAADNVDAIILGTVTFSDNLETIKTISKSIPIIATVNRIDPTGISAMSGVDWNEMGEKSGEYLVSYLRGSNEKQYVAWFPGAGAAGVSSTENSSFLNAISSANIEIVAKKYGDTGRLVQQALIEDSLDQHENIDYIVGAGVSAEAAISSLRLYNRQLETNIISHYMTHGVYRGIKRGKVLAASTDQPTLQGKLAIDLAVRILEKQPYLKHAGPEVLLIDQNNVSSFNVRDSLSPAFFKPVFNVEAN